MPWSAPSLAAVRRHKVLALAILLALVAASLLVPRWLRGPDVQVATVVQRDFVQSVVASGRVESPHRISLGSQITATVVKVPVAEGQAVPAGATLAELESAELRAAVAQADFAIGQAQARLRQVREVQAPVAEQALQQAQANHEAAGAALARSRELFDKGFVGQAALDEATRAARTAEAQWRSARQQVASSQPAGSDRVAAEAALAQAQAAAAAARARLAHATIVAPVAGTLIGRSVEPGDVVQPGRTLLVLSPAGETQLVAQIDERHLRLLKPGQKALASADAYEQQRFAAELVFINPAVDPQRGAVEVKFRVPSPPDYLRQDMTVSVDVEVARRPAAVLVPTEAVRESGGAAWVWKVSDGRLQRQPVRLGLRSAGLAEVLEGLARDDAVVIGPAGTLQEGARVRPVPRSA